MATNNATNTSNPITVAQGGSGVASNTAYAVLCGGTTSTGAIQSIASVGTSGHVLTSNGAGALPTFQAAGGGSILLQQVRASTASGTSTSSQYSNSSAPTTSNGAQSISLSITPSNVNNILVIQHTGLYACSSSSSVILALFQDAGATCLYADGSVTATTTFRNFTYYMTAGTTSSTTFKVRFGPNSAVTAYFNTLNDGTSNYGGKALSTLIISEYSV